MHKHHFLCPSSQHEATSQALQSQFSWKACVLLQGLGEMMPEQLWSTTMNPKTRMLRRLTVQDAVEASRVFTLLMGDKVAPRRQLIEEHGSKMMIEDLDI